MDRFARSWRARGARVAYCPADHVHRADAHWCAAREIATATGPLRQDGNSDSHLFRLREFACGCACVDRTRNDTGRDRPMVGSRPLCELRGVSAGAAGRVRRENAARNRGDVMSILARYLIRATLSYTFLVLVILLVLSGGYIFIEQQDDIGVGSYGVGRALIYVVCTLPQYAFDLLPMA